ncbi:DUF1707 SHOCT-like domain-containing protein [Corynebacterium bouchesdurhonense]|uniref:DUF1707 SHOCT-like domain-containing protein n=1 Tax=Corynebacterium bouchesdurhonense TaxID=1720192 RepID=UPI0008359BBA|nr:DUF1707 domain-containing protein [Corynebacterium bouchesdurhonense]
MSQPHSDNLPRKRVSQVARQHAVDTLTAAYSDGQLSTQEFDERSAAAWRATFHDDLIPLIADLDIAEPTLADVTSTHPVLPTGEPGGVATSFAVMGGVEHHGDWLIAPSHLSIAFMGGTDLNLQRARLSSAHTSIRVAAVMGGGRVVVPEDVRVKSEGAAIMGGFGIVDHPSVTVPQSELPPNAPSITISGFSLMGGVEVIRAARDAEVG